MNIKFAWIFRVLAAGLILFVLLSFGIKQYNRFNRRMDIIEWRYFTDSGMTHLEKCEFIPAQQQLTLALDKAKKVDRQYELGMSLYNLAESYSNAGDYKKAEILYLQSIKTLGNIKTDHKYMWLDLICLSDTYYNQERYNEAEIQAKRALKIAKTWQGKSKYDLNIATTLDTLAHAYRGERRFTESVSLYKKSLAIKEKAQNTPLKSQEIARSLDYLGNLCLDNLQYNKAELSYQKALHFLGNGHKENLLTAVTLNNLAEVYYKEKLYSKAMPFCDRALQISQKIMGDSRPETMKDLLFCARVHLALHDYINASNLYKRWLDGNVNKKHDAKFIEVQNFYRSALQKAHNRECK